MLSRRTALKVGATGLLPFVLVGCGGEDEPTEPTATLVPTEVPVAVGTPLSDTFTVAGTPSHTADPAVRTFQGAPGRTGSMPGPGPSLYFPIIIKWKYDLQENGTTAPVIVDGILYLAVRREIIALNSATGEEVWRFETGDSVYCTPTVASGIVYVGSNDEHLYAIHAQTGEGLWKSHLGGAMHGSPAVVDGVVYATMIGNGRITEEHSSRGAEGRLFAVDARNGKELWRFTMAGLSYCAPAVAGNEVFTTCTEGYVYAISTTDGAELWRHQVGSGSRMSPLVAHGMVYASLDAPDFYALDASTGNEVWRFPMGDTLRSAPTVREGVIYFGSSNATMYAVDARLGQEKWRYTWNGNFYTNFTPAVVDDTVFLGMTALDAETGQPIDGFDNPLRDTISSTQNSVQGVIDGFIYVPTSEYLLALANLKPTLLVEGAVIRGAPSPSGVRYGSGLVGDEVTSILAREDVNGETWVQATINGTTGWIPLTAIDPATLPPEEPIEYVYTPGPGMVPSPTPVPTPVPSPTPYQTPELPPDFEFAVGDTVVTIDRAELKRRAMKSAFTISTLPAGTELEILSGPRRAQEEDWYEVSVMTDGSEGFVLRRLLRYPE